ncbi:MAG: tripartite tricarboxylate transporter substrate binding protein [Halomonas sp.]|uniref:Bug family tripartite tricarboxylate transporter substrate binding protein n=1 Tax=Halomonas sp. TaxID=1486246 RepID=UPI00183DFFB8|nr:tripartite tricarboxylate transporter substrate binding protein [Halomonas sp.]NWN81772.1 tripartite tricarboxylate transporter substrate binding protein [Halomonas sp.]
MYIKKVHVATAVLGVAIAEAFNPLTAVAQESWPPKKVTFVVALGPGGSADRTARALAQRLQDTLDTPISVINQEGGGGHVGHTYFQNMPDDGSYFLASSIHPYISNAMLRFDADYDLSDFAFINGQWNDHDLFAVNADTPYETMGDFMAAAKENPGTLRVSVVPGSTGAINLELALEGFGLDKDDVNIVTYQSGGAARTAVAGGQVDMTVLAADGTLSIKEYIRPLALAAESPSEDWDAPTLNTVLEENGNETVPVLAGSMRGLAAHATFKEKHPEAFQKMVDAYQSVLQDEEFVENLESQDIGTEWLGPERTTEIIESNFEILQRYTPEEE